MSSESLGSRLRARRRAKRLTLREVADRTELTESFLSQLERGISSASVATLQRLCSVLGLSVGDLFDESWSRDPRIHRHGEGTYLKFGTDAQKVRVSPKANQNLEVLVGEIGPGGSTGTERYAHGDSEETLVVLEGTVEVTVGEETHQLGALDSISYRSSQPHRVVEVEGTKARVLWAIGPPSY